VSIIAEARFTDKEFERVQAAVNYLRSSGSQRLTFRKFVEATVKQEVDRILVERERTKNRIKELRVIGD
jgi:hypothetical protein